MTHPPESAVPESLEERRLHLDEMRLQLERDRDADARRFLNDGLVRTHHALIGSGARWFPLRAEGCAAAFD